MDENKTTPQNLTPEDELDLLLEQFLAEEDPTTEDASTITAEELLQVAEAEDAQKPDEEEELTYRRVLIATFINKVYLYDDRISIFFNTGSTTQVEVDETFIDYVEEQDAAAECSLIDETAPP